MRPIKFRAWYHTGHIEQGAMQYEPRFNNNKWTVLDTDGLWKATNCVEIMQYTGLKDKNGKEIYEGDIVKLTTELQETRIFRIEWDEDCYMLRNNKQELGAVASTMKELGEVIGNIYENKDLIK